MSHAALWFGIISIFILLLGHFRMIRVWRRSPPLTGRPKRFPSVSVIRPIRGLDVGAEENIRALLASEYPGTFELLFVLDGKDDPAYPKLREWLMRMPTRASRVEVLLSGQPPRGQTGKLNAMMVGVAQAKGDLLAFNDSDTRPAPTVLAQVVAGLVEDPKNGSAFSPVYAEADLPLAGDVAYGLLVNSWYGSSVRLAAGPKGEMPFIMGQLMVLRREALQSVGGLSCLEGQLIDDMYLGMQLASAGWRNRVVMEAPLRIATGDLPLRDFFPVFRRWLLFSKSGLNFSFTWPNWERGIAGWLAWLGLLGGAVSGSPEAVAWALGALTFSCYTQSQQQKASGATGLSARHFWVPAILPLYSAAAAVFSFGSRSIDWRGRSYALTKDGALADKVSPVPAERVP